MNEENLRQRAMRLLARREHCRSELANKLLKDGDAAEVKALLDQLEETGLLSDARFAESFVRAKGDRMGVAKLRQSLRGKGLDKDLVATSIAAADLPDEMLRARALWSRKFGESPPNAREWARQARFLQGRGFSTEVIRRLLKEPKDGE